MDPGLIGTIVASVLGLGGIIYTRRGDKKTSQGEHANKIIDQLQERVQYAEERQDKSERRIMQLMNYVGVLRNHIDSGTPPPAPPYPPELTQ